MALVEGTDFVFAPRATFAATDVSAVNTCGIVGTRGRRKKLEPEKSSGRKPIKQLIKFYEKGE